MILERLNHRQALDAYPDGWSCVNCGKVYNKKTIDLKKFYVIHTEHGTECKKCAEEVA